MFLSQSKNPNNLLDSGKYNLLYELERECNIYNFLRKKHYKEIPLSVIRNKFPKYTYEVKKYVDHKSKEIYLVKPVIWIRVGDPRLKLNTFYGRIKYFEVDFILIDEKDIPFYLLRKYGRNKGIELEIFTELKKIKKEIKEHNRKLREQDRKHYRKMREQERKKEARRKKK